MKKSVALIMGASLALAATSPAFAMCLRGQHANLEQSYASSEQQKDEVKSEEAMSTFDPAALKTDEAQAIETQPELEAIKTIVTE